jgi:hypothetical protein
MGVEEFRNWEIEKFKDLDSDTFNVRDYLAECRDLFDNKALIR